MPLAALLASPAERGDAIDGGVFQQSRLDGLGNGGRISKAAGGQRELRRFTTLLGNAVRNTFAPSLEVSSAGNGIDADHILRVVGGKILAAGQTSGVLFI